MTSNVYIEMANVITKGKVKMIVEMLDPKNRNGNFIERNVREYLNKSLGKLGVEYDTIEENIERMISCCLKDTGEVTELIENFVGLNQVFAFANNEDKLFDIGISEKQTFVADVVRQLIVGDHLDNLLKQDHTSQRDYLPQTLDELLVNKYDDEISDSRHDTNLPKNDTSEDYFAEAPNLKLPILIHTNGKPIGKVYLSADQVNLENPTKSIMAKYGSSSIVPIPITSEIRKTIQMFSFESFDEDMQNFGTITLSKQIFKLYQLYVDQNKPICTSIFKEDTVESLLKRLDVAYSNEVTKVVGLYADNKLLKLQSNIWETIQKYDKLILSFGKTSLTSYFEESKWVYLKGWDGLQICVDLLDIESSDSFINRINTLFEVKNSPLNFNYRTKRIKEGKLMSDYKVEEGDIIHFSLPNVGGTGKFFLSIDLSNVSVMTGVGTDAEYGYAYGLNAIGNCKNIKCPSSGGIVYYKLGYPEMEIMDAKRNEYLCPRCFEEEITVHSFLMAAGRAKFVFRKIGRDKDEVMFLESTSTDHSHYSKFNVNNFKNTDTGVEYDFIRIYTVKFDYSFDKCQGCDRAIHLNEQEIKECGRAFHKSCLNETDGKCPTCLQPEISLDELQSKLDGAQDISVNLKIPNKTYGECPITYTNQGNSIHGSLKDFIQLMNRNKVVSQRHFSELIDMQLTFVNQNRDRLIQVTTVNTSLLAFLVSRGVLHMDDELFLLTINHPIQRANEMYKIISKQIDGLKVLYEACEETKQSGAAAVLTNFILKMKNNFTPFLKDGSKLKRC